MKFEQWMDKVNAALLLLCGMSCDDLPDYDYYSAWNDDEDPKRTARKVIADAENCF